MENSGEAAAKTSCSNISNHLRRYEMPNTRTASENETTRTAAEIFDSAIDDWGSTVLRLAISRLGCHADAEDVYQTVFLKLFQTNTRFRDEEHLKAWLLRVTINCCNDAHRNPWRKRRSELDTTAIARLETPVKNDNDGDEELARALAMLTDRQRTAIHLFYFEGYATDEIAKITGERPATVRSHLHRARKTLRDELGAQL